MDKKYQKKAFGLLEVLLAGVIIIIVLSALMVVARSSMDNSILLQQRAQATYLAQEGIEIVRQVRDTNYIDESNTTKWNTLVGDNSMGGFIDSHIYVVKDTPVVNRQRIVQKTSNPGESGSVSIDGTTYQRNIYFVKSGANGSLQNPLLQYNSQPVTEQSFKVRVSIAWSSKNVNKKIEIESLLTNSRQGF